jgi:p-aminobenzoyl-glutamate transporter AbgT
MVAYASASMLVGLIADVLAKLLAKYLQESSLRTREKSLSDTAPLVEEVIIGYFLLIFIPVTSIL